MKTENEAYTLLLDSHLSGIIARLRAVPPDRLDWAPAPAAPSCRMAAEHAWVWLVCDRQHLTEPDTTCHPLIPDAPATAEALCEALEAEKGAWTEMIAELTPEQFDEVRYQFGSWPMSVRQLVAHITQQVIYKSGQLSTLFFALGLDGDAPYTAPHPNDHYASLGELMAQPLYAAILKSDVNALSAALATDTPIDLSAANLNPLELAVYRNSSEMVSMLLENGADCNQKFEGENSPLIMAAFLGSVEIVKLLINHGADINVRNKWDRSPLSVARKHNHVDVVEQLVEAGASD